MLYAICYMLYVVSCWLYVANYMKLVFFDDVYTGIVVAEDAGPLPRMIAGKNSCSVG